MNRSLITLICMAPFVLLTPEGRAQEAATDTESPAVSAGLLAGRVVSAAADAPITGVLITAEGAAGTRFAQTDENGKFSLELPAGNYELTLNHPRYGTKTRGGISIDNGVEFATTFRLASDGTAASADVSDDDLESIEVRGTYIPSGRDSARWSESVVDVLSAEDFALTGDSNAVDALIRAPGLSVVDGKYVYVRGLGERYSNTTLNSASLPSPDPTRRVIPLDLFPTGVLESVDIQKTYSPDLPGDFSGGTIKLKTRSVPDEPVRSISFNIEANSEATGRPGLRLEGGDRDAFGFDDGFRDLPTTLNDVTQGGAVSLNNVSDADREAAGESLDNAYDTRLEDSPTNFGMQFALGNRYDAANGSSFGYLLGVRYDNDWSQRKEQRSTSALTGDGDVVALDEGTQFRTENTVDFSGMLNLEWGISDLHTLRNTVLVTRRTDSRGIREINFLAENDFNVADTTFEFVERQLFTEQLSGEHLLGDSGDKELDWFVSLSRAERTEPDTRFYRYEQRDDGLYAFSEERGLSNERSWEDLTDDAVNVGVDFAMPVTLSSQIGGTLKTGVNYLRKERDSAFRRFRYITDLSRNDLDETLGASSPGDIFTPDVIGPGLWELEETTLATDNYDAIETIQGVYVTADADVGETWRIAGGVRYETSDQEVATFELFDATARDEDTLDASEWLPALTATWTYSDSQQLRFGYSRTLNRPDLKELSNAPYIDPEERYVVIGNPDLQLATVDNFDVRWEWYFDSQDSLQIAAFYKSFDNPIERVIREGAGGLRTFANAVSAINQGVEFQARKSLPRDLFVSINGALIDSEVDIGAAGAQQTTNNRELQGQSPWTANLQIGYDNPDRDIQAALLFNMSGERINDVGTQGLPDAYQQPVARLDFNYRQAVRLWSQTFNVQVRGRNLLDPVFEVKRGNRIERSWNLGRTVSLGFNYEF